MAEAGPMPDLGNINEMFKDNEFKDFFNQFTNGMFNEGAAPENMPPNEMMESMMKEFGNMLMAGGGIA